MVQNLANPDVLVIGAGAAGIGAGRALARAKVPFLIIEAKDRIGGRAFTDTTSLGHLWDQGCHWFHSADQNILRQLAEEIGHKFVNRRRSAIMKSFMDGAWRSGSHPGRFRMGHFGQGRSRRAETAGMSRPRRSSIAIILGTRWQGIGWP